MLRRFNLKNFMSFDKREDGKSEEFSMIPGKAVDKVDHIICEGDSKLLKFAAIYGANASGKSNFVRALDCMRFVVLSGTTKGFTNKYCRIQAENQKLPSYFEVEIVIEGKVYSYGFEVVLQESRFISEWLYELQPDGSDIMIFERDTTKSRIQFRNEWKNRDGLKQRFDVYSSDVESNDQSLFLKYMNRDKESFYNSFPEVDIIKKMFQWFYSTLDITFPSNAVGYSYFVNSDDLTKATEIISAFGTGIFKCTPSITYLEDLYMQIPQEFRDKLNGEVEASQLRVTSSTSENAKVNITVNISGEMYMISINKDYGIKCNRITFFHSENGLPFSFGEESDGTQRLWELLEILLSDKRKTYVIDEMDRCLHPSLTYRFVDTFFKFANKRQKQLIVTTHESRLMDFDLLRRDEIWFTDRRNGGETDMYSLEEFNDHFDNKVDKAYLEGRYGGIPLFTSIFPIKEGD